MSNPHANLSEDQEQHVDEASRLAYLKATFGPDIALGLGTDQEPTGGSTTARHVDQDRRRQYVERRRAEVQDVNERAAQEEAKKAAYERVQSGQSTTYQDQHLAAAYALEQGIVRPKSTRQRLIEQGRGGRRAGTT